jgi:hypothetical protein
MHMRFSHHTRESLARCHLFVRKATAAVQFNHIAAAAPALARSAVRWRFECLHKRRNNPALNYPERRQKGAALTPAAVASSLNFLLPRIDSSRSRFLIPRCKRVKMLTRIFATLTFHKHTFYIREV